MLAISDALATAAADAGVVWAIAQTIATYEPVTPHPYSILGTRNPAAVVKKLIAISAWPDAESVGHPLGEYAIDEALTEEADVAWASHVAKTDDVEKCVMSRLASGLPIAELRGELDPKTPKSKLKSRWKDTVAAHTASAASLLIISQAIREVFEAAGVEADYHPFSIADTELGVQRDDLWIVHPHHVMPWVDWSKSDVGLRWSSLMDEFFELHTNEESRASTIPLVRVEGSSLILVHSALAASLTRAGGFRLMPLDERGISLNLDDRFTD